MFTLRLLDIDAAIRKYNWKEVTTARGIIDRKKLKLDPNGLWSEEIFGRIGTPERKYRFGYIRLNVQVLHPYAYLLLKSDMPEIAKVIAMKQRFDLVDGRLIKSDSGSIYGITQLVKVLDKFKWQKPEVAKFYKKYAKRIVIDKWPVLPAGLRDIHISGTTGRPNIESSDLNGYYETLLNYAVMANTDPDTAGYFIQNTLDKIMKWFEQLIGSKSGFLHVELLKKTVDYSARLVLNADAKLKPNQIGIGWNILLKLFEPFVVRRIEKDKTLLSFVEQYTGKSTQDAIEKFLRDVAYRPDIVPPAIKDKLVDMVKDVVRDKVILMKRDPVENRTSWLAMDEILPIDGQVAKVSPWILSAIGGDLDGDTVAVYPLFTQQAIKTAKEKMLPNKADVWSNPVSLDRGTFEIEEDLATIIYRATRKP